jgi:hypothetical protein
LIIFFEGVGLLYKEFAVQGTTMNKRMSRDNAQKKGVLRIGFCILTVREFLLLFRPAVIIFFFC